MLAWQEEHRELLEYPARWTQVCKLEVFENDSNISVEKIKNKGVNMRRKYVKVRQQFQDRTGFGVTGETCDETIAGKYIF